MEYKCDQCNKVYSSRQSRWNHIKKYHIHVNETNVSNVTKDVTKNVTNVTICNNVNKNEEIKCKYCDEKFKSRQTRWRHEKICKSEEQKSDNINELKKQNDAMQKQLEELKDLIQKSMKIHPKTLQKINSQLGNIVNGDVNNYVVQLGYEYFDKVLSEKEKNG